MRVLAGQPHGQLLVEAFVIGQHAARLHRYGGEPVLQDSLLHHDVRFLECGFSQVERRVGEVPAHVVRSGLMRLRSALRERLLEVHHNGQVVVVDLDHVGRVGRLPLALREHHGDDLALIGDLLLGDGEPLGDVLLLGHESGRGRMRAGELALEIARGVDADDAGRLACVRDVDALDARVSDGAAHERNLAHSVQANVSDIP